MPICTCLLHLILGSIAKQVCRVYRMGTLNPDPKAKKNLAAGAKSIGPIKDSEVIFRRPFGCGVVDLGNADVHQFEHGKEVESTMMLFKVINKTLRKQKHAFYSNMYIFLTISLLFCTPLVAFCHT